MASSGRGGVVSTGSSLGDGVVGVFLSSLSDDTSTFTLGRIGTTGNCVSSLLKEEKKLSFHIRVT